MRLAFLFWLTAVVAASALEPPRDFVDAAQDGTGLLWAFRDSHVDSVYRFDGRSWAQSDALFDREEQSRFLQVATLSDGAVACVWRLKNQRIAVTWHHGKESRLLGTCGCEFTDQDGRWDPPLADSQGRLWITGPCARIYRADAKGISLVHQITPEELRVPARAGMRHNAVHAVEDGRRRVWAWSDTFSGPSSLRGVLIFTGDTAKLHNVLPSFGMNVNILALARADEGHLWMAVSGGGIYRIDSDTLALERVPDPVADTLRDVRELHPDGNDLYVVDDKAEGSSLWRWRGGQWTHLIPQLDRQRVRSLPRSWLPVKGGLLISSFGADGPWYLPREGEPAQFSWRSGFALEDAYALTQLPSGTFFGLGNGMEFFQGALSLPPRDQPVERVSVIKVQRSGTNPRLTPDAAAHLWMIRDDSPGSLSEWNGDAWVEHQMPNAEVASGPERNGLREMLTDAEGRVWVPPGSGRKVLLVFNPPTDEWQTFAGVQDAYLRLRFHPPHFLPPHPVSSVLLDPQYSADRQRIAYREGTSDLHYHNGSHWQHFTSQQITGKTGGNSGLGPPWFDLDGNLCVNIFREATWRRDAAGHWSKTDFQSHFPTDLWSEREFTGAEVTPPPGCVPSTYLPLASDNLGTVWVSSQGGLYRCVPGRCVKVLGDGEASPFASTCPVQQIFVDCRGNAFLRIRPGRKEEIVMIKPSPAAPHVTVGLEFVGTDAVEARLHVAPALNVQLSWRLDEGPWQKTEKSALTLVGLSDGAHTLSVSAVDAALQAEGKPTLAKFTVTVDPYRQITDLIARLAVPDDEQRKAAVEALARQPDRAAPALQKARGTAEDDQRWWIDAALQQIETNQRK